MQMASEALIKANSLKHEAELCRRWASSRIRESEGGVGENRNKLVDDGINAYILATSFLSEAKDEAVLHGDLALAAKLAMRSADTNMVAARLSSNAINMIGAAEYLYISALHDCIYALRIGRQIGDFGGLRRKVAVIISEIEAQSIELNKRTESAQPKPIITKPIKSVLSRAKSELTFEPAQSSG